MNDKQYCWMFGEHKDDPCPCGWKSVNDPRIALNKLIAFVCTCKKHNTPEWMAMLADRLNDAIAASGSDDRVRWPGKWASEFNFESGGPA